MNESIPNNQSENTIDKTTIGLENKIERQRQNVLVIDDQVGVEDSSHQKSFLRNYRDLPFNFEFESCAIGDGDFSVEKSVEAVSRYQPDFILHDVTFGEKRQFGFDSLVEIKKNFPEIKVFMLSSNEQDEEHLRKAKEGGASDCLQKHRSAAYLFKGVTGEEL